MWRAAAVIGVMLFAGSGCAKTYRIDLQVTVTDEVDGLPIMGVELHRNMWGEKSDPKTVETVLRTDESGRAFESFTVTDAAFSAGKPAWLLRVLKEGYEPEIVEFKPRAAPGDSPTRLEVPVRLRRGKR